MDDHLSEDIDIDGVGTFHRYAYMPLQVDGRDSRFYAGFTGEIDSDDAAEADWLSSLNTSSHNSFKV